jgi:hypothetical protein
MPGCNCCNRLVHGQAKQQYAEFEQAISPGRKFGLCHCVARHSPVHAEGIRLLLSADERSGTFGRLESAAAEA